MIVHRADENGGRKRVNMKKGNPGNIQYASQHAKLPVSPLSCPGFVPPVAEPCMGALGIQHGLADSAFSASSEWSSSYKAFYARLHRQPGPGQGSWAAKTNNQHQWLQVDLGKVTKVRRVATQGRQDRDQWVLSYSLAYSLDGLLFEPYKKNGYATVSVLLHYYY